MQSNAFAVTQFWPRRIKKTGHTIFAPVNARRGGQLLVAFKIVLHGISTEGACSGPGVWNSALPPPEQTHFLPSKHGDQEARTKVLGHQ